MKLILNRCLLLGLPGQDGNPGLPGSPGPPGSRGNIQRLFFVLLDL